MLSYSLPTGLMPLRTPATQTQALLTGLMPLHTPATHTQALMTGLHAPVQE